MDSKHIEQLLERYWRCETSVEEEAQLRAFFNGGDVPAHLLPYRELFVYQQFLQQEGLGEEFDRQVLAQVEVPVVKARRMTLVSRFIPLAKAAAAIALLLSLGNIMQHSIFVDEGGVPAPDTIGRQISAPSVAFSDYGSDAHGKQLIDSLKRVEQQKRREDSKK